MAKYMHENAEVYRAKITYIQHYNHIDDERQVDCYGPYTKIGPAKAAITEFMKKTYSLSSKTDIVAAVQIKKDTWETLTVWKP